jgi:uncharacterized protein (TIGR00297 family)
MAKAVKILQTKELRTASVVAKAGRRDAMQVLANGAVFAVTAVVAGQMSLPAATFFSAAALGALAAASADTLATEIGTLAGGQPRSLISWRPVPPGTSGGVTLAGSLAMVGGALLIAIGSRALGLGSAVLAAAVGGVAGALADSLIGAVLQERRYCARCDLATEQRLHDCGATTSLAGGVAWLDNDLVNLCATLVGATVAATLVVV